MYPHIPSLKKLHYINNKRNVSETILKFVKYCCKEKCTIVTHKFKKMYICGINIFSYTFAKSYEIYIFTI